MLAAQHDDDDDFLFIFYLGFLFLVTKNVTHSSYPLAHLTIYVNRGLG